MHRNCTIVHGDMKSRLYDKAHVDMYNLKYRETSIRFCGAGEIERGNRKQDIGNGRQDRQGLIWLAGGWWCWRLD